MTNYVTFVGAGCGHGLITIAGLTAVKNADAIIYDDLIDTDILSHVKEDCELIYVGKRKGNHSADQDEINRMLIHCASVYNHTVRLKGGDSFVFGRGGEEADALDKANIEYCFIPGVSSSIAAAEAAGIPVTHRGLSRGFCVFTGHTGDNSEIDYSSIAKTDSTLVFLMGLSKLERISTSLISSGMNPETPCSIISRACMRDQKRYDGTLANICEESLGAKTPGVIIVGEVCKFNFTSEEKKKSILVTGSEGFCEKFEKSVPYGKFDIYTKATMKIKAYRDFLPENFCLSYDTIVLTSPNGVRTFFEEMRRTKTDIRLLSSLRFAVTGPGTAAELDKYGIFPEYIPEQYTVENLAKLIVEKKKEVGRVLILRSSMGSLSLNRVLDDNEIVYSDIHTYTVETKECYGKIPETDYIVFSSAGGVKSYFESGAEICADKIICIGSITGDELKRHTKRKFEVCTNHTVNGIIDKIQ